MLWHYQPWVTRMTAIWLLCLRGNALSLQKPVLFIMLTHTLCNLGYPPGIHLKIKSREISSIYNTRFNCRIVLKFCTGHGSDTAVRCAKFWWYCCALCSISERPNVWNKGYGQTRFREICVFGQVSHIAQGPCVLHCSWANTMQTHTDISHRYEQNDTIHRLNKYQLCKMTLATPYSVNR